MKKSKITVVYIVLIALIILLCCGMCISESPIGILTVIRSAVLVILGIAGGILAVNRKEKVRIK